MTQLHQAETQHRRIDWLKSCTNFARAFWAIAAYVGLLAAILYLASADSNRSHGMVAFIATLYTAGAHWLLFSFVEREDAD